MYVTQISNHGNELGIYIALKNYLGGFFFFCVLGDEIIFVLRMDNANFKKPC